MQRKWYSQQPTLSETEINQSLYARHMNSVEHEDSNYYSFVWGFDPYPEAGLPFCYRLEIRYQETPPVFENTIYSMSYMFADVATWFRDKEDKPMLWPEEEEVIDIIREHILLRAGVGLDRSEKISQRTQFLQETSVVFGENFVPEEVLSVVKTNFSNGHPFVLAAAYDAWRLGDYKNAKLYLSERLKFEPYAPSIMLV